ncbi:hypothetical protein ACIBEJ_02565 [Nonomuraea sp. NPDC050790]|uniref:hypothetical protein n=1 Tax=Nonomuraea sp. NPDC050790 TaxID=3364371 RepID=UPI00379523E3
MKGALRSNHSSDRLHPAAPLDDLITRVRLRRPDATGEFIAAALHSSPSCTPELEALAADNQTLRVLLGELAQAGGRT